MGLRFPTQQKKFKLSFTERLLGMSPSSQEVYSKFIIERKAPNPDAPEVKEELETISESDEKDQLVTIFHRDVEGCYLIDYQVKGFLKNAGNVLKDILKIKALRSKIDNFVFVFPRYIWVAEKPDGIFARSLRAQTAQGPRITIARSEFIEPPCPIEITIELLPHPQIKWKTIYTLLDYGSRVGIGQFRNGSFGRFTWEELKQKRN